MNTETLISNQKEEIKKYLDDFKSFPHNKASVFILIVLPIFLWIVTLQLIKSPAYEEVFTALWSSGVYNSFPYYNLIFTVTTYAIQVHFISSALVESSRFDSFLETTKCIYSLKKLFQQTEDAEKTNTLNYSFDKTLLSDDVFSQCKTTLGIINGKISFFMRIEHFVRLVSFIVMTIGGGVIVSIPLCTKFSQCQLFSPVEYDLTMIFIVIAIITSIVCSGGILLTTFAARDNKEIINPLIFAAIFIGSIFLSTIVALAIPGIIAVSCWVIYGIIVIAIELIALIIEVVVDILSALLGLFIVIIIIAAVISALIDGL